MKKVVKCTAKKRLCEDLHYCLADNKNNFMICTRKKGHKGSHIVCGGESFHNLEVWE